MKNNLSTFLLILLSFLSVCVLSTHDHTSNEETTSYETTSYDSSSYETSSQTESSSTPSISSFVNSSSMLGPTSTSDSSSPQMTVYESTVENTQQITITITWDSSDTTLDNETLWWTQWDTFPLTVYQMEECIEFFNDQSASSNILLLYSISFNFS